MMSSIYKKHCIKLLDVKSIHIILLVWTVSLPVNIPSCITNFLKVVGNGKNEMIIERKMFMNIPCNGNSVNWNQFLN